MTLSTYHDHPGEIISHAVWLYHRFNLSFRNVEEILVSRGVDITYESVRQWCFRFGTEYAERIRSRAGRQGDTWHLDEVFINIKGRQYYLWRAVDQDGDVLDGLISAKRIRRFGSLSIRILGNRSTHPLLAILLKSANSSYSFMALMLQ